MSIELEFAHHRSSLGEPLPLTFFSYRLDILNRVSPRIEARPQQCQRQSFAVSRHSASFAGVQSFRGDVANEVNLIRQATSIPRIGKPRNFIRSGQVPARPASLEEGEGEEGTSSRNKRVSIVTSFGRFEQKGNERKEKRIVRFYTYRFAWNRWDSPTVSGNSETFVLRSRFPTWVSLVRR